MAELDFDQRQTLWVDAAQRGLRAEVPGSSRTLGELARVLLDIAGAGLRRHAPEDLRYLEPMREIADSGRTQADALRDLWHRTNGAPGPVIDALALTR
ncbi:hypothetical protein [Haliangium sp.]|uniref:hypothetical protein n=1 Tax=Haliangium sp. TaxID=2663208 RepID=UPI003D13C2D7